MQDVWHATPKDHDRQVKNHCFKGSNYLDQHENQGCHINPVCKAWRQSRGHKEKVMEYAYVNQKQMWQDLCITEFLRGKTGQMPNAVLVSVGKNLSSEK